MNTPRQSVIPAVQDMRTAASLLSNITRKYSDRPTVIKLLATELAQLAIAEERASASQWQGLLSNQVAVKG